MPLIFEVNETLKVECSKSTVSRSSKKGAMSALGQNRKSRSALPSSGVPSIVLQKSFFRRWQNF
jgi:hypothetical protein